jgi:hypothetical protein
VTFTKPISLLAAAVLALTLTACSSGDGGSSSSSGYCDQLKAAKSSVDDTNLTNLTDDKFQQLVDDVHALESSAPSSVQDDWQTFGDFIDQFQSILKDAGLSFDDLSALQNGQVPDGVSLAKLQAAGQQLQQLDSTKLAAAQQAIADNAKSECNIDLQTTPPSN